MTWLDTLRLKSPNPRLRCKAVDNLSGSIRPSDTELLYASLHDESAEVRCAAARALAKTDSPETRDSLVTALKDANFLVREAAARALGQLRALSCAGALVPHLKDPDAAVRIAAAGALRSMGWKPATQQEVAWFEVALGNTPPPVSRSETKAVGTHTENQDTTFHRRLAAEAMKERNDPVRIATLVASLRSDDLLARTSAIHDLGEINDPQIRQELLNLFRDPEPEIRLAAAQALSGRDDSPPGHFVGLLQDPNPEVRLIAVNFLGRIRYGRIAELLFPLLDDPSVKVREAAAASLGRIGNPRAIESLVVCLADEDEYMRRTAERALRAIDPRWMHSGATTSARARLEALLAERSPSDRRIVEQVLERLPQATNVTAGR